jgi:pimeloyl-ACP methyl ester carboxylesterase
MNFKKPKLKNAILEPFRVNQEIIKFLLTKKVDKDKIKDISNNDINSVLFIPGFMAGDISTHLTRKHIEKHNISAFPSGMSFNHGFRENQIKELINKIEIIKEELDSKNKMVLVGHSLGGVYAKEISKLRPDLIDKIITMGSPLFDKHGSGSSSMVSSLYNFINKESELSEFELSILENYDVLPEVESHSFYSKTDGVVHWETSLYPESENHHNYEFDCSHCGMIFDNKVVNKIIDLI